MRVCKIGVQSTLDMSHQYFILEYTLLNVLGRYPRRFTKVVNGMHSNSLFAMHWPLAA